MLPGPRTGGGVAGIPDASLSFRSSYRTTTVFPSQRYLISKYFWEGRIKGLSASKHALSLELQLNGFSELKKLVNGAGDGIRTHGSLLGKLVSVRMAIEV